MSTTEKSKEELILEVRQKREMKKDRRRKQKTASLTATITILVITTGVFFTVSAKEINITEIDEFNGRKETKTVYTLGGSVSEVLESQNLDLDEHDRINIPINSEITTDEDIVITRGKKITIVVDGVEDDAVVTKANARDALVEAGYIPSETDEISVHNGEDLTDSDKIELVSVTTAQDVTNETIEYETEYINDPTLEEGRTVVMDEGHNGTRAVTSNVIYRSGEEFYREVISNDVTVEPQKRVIAVGTKKKVEEPKKAETQKSTAKNNSQSANSDSSKSSPAPSPSSGGEINGIKYSKKITMDGTAYTTSPSENGGYSVSAMGTPLSRGIVAVDPKVIPLGTKLYITSLDGKWAYGYASAEDTGGAIKGNKIDLCFDSDEEARQFGRQNCIVYILE